MKDISRISFCALVRNNCISFKKAVTEVELAKDAT